MIFVHIRKINDQTERKEAVALIKHHFVDSNEKIRKQKRLFNILAFEWNSINSKSSFEIAIRFVLRRMRSFIQLSSVLTSLVNAAIDKYEPMLRDTMHALNRQIWMKIMYCKTNAIV